QLGIGFSLGGLSIIHRCAKTIATDRIKGGVNYDSNDRYCLDGQRLIAISGTDGQSGSEYRTEINNFSKVKYNGNHWTVQTKSGQTFEYGNTPDSKIEAQGKSVVRLWTVNKITDAANNTINYIYNEDNANGEYTLSRINYTNNSVRLTYEDRNDTHTSYQAGGKLRQTKRLSNITTYVNNNSIRTYDLEYQYQGTPKRSQLTSIEECVNGQCLPKTEFKWQHNAGNFFLGEQWQNDLGEDWKNRPIHKSGKHSILIDMNGDGMPDRVFDRIPSNNDQQALFVYYNTGSGFDSGHQEQGDLGDAWKNRPIYKGGEHSTLIDMNGDGLIDRVFDRNPSNNQQGMYVYLNTGSGFYSGQQWQNDIGEDWKNRPIHKGGEYSTLIDMNGDGLPDRILDRNPSDQQGIYVYLNTGSGFDSGQQWQNDLGDDWKNRPIHKSGKHSTLIDMNGDGLPDRVFDGNPSNDQQGIYV
ncbi:VCBS repeat-containing protein, partial [Bathymodiolus heckerae thiotrophic gill symbiont]|uniref:VCBS repeat-containing protein n=1 Tax=Bathymodiolus heckerae thiotrophic gill symbiont TaxID=1052212 RepID=UPI001FCF13C3